jgi:hypothetical protein
MDRTLAPVAPRPPPGRALAALLALVFFASCAADPLGPGPSGPGACAEGSVTTACLCGGATHDAGFCCANAWQSVACGTPGACAEGAISTACTCGGATHDAGFCCANAWQAVACGTPGACAEGAISAACTCGGATHDAGFCCANAWQSVACGPPPTTDLIPAERLTAWNPGILSDGQLGLPLGVDGLPQRTTICSTLSPGSDVQAAVDACPAGQVVLLQPGTFTVSRTVTLTKGVVLRGSGSEGAPTGTTIVKTGGGSVLAIGTDQDQTCHPTGTARSLTLDAARESTTLALGAAAAAAFTVGDLAFVDQLDEPEVDQGDCSYFKRISGRSATQRVEVAAVDAMAGTLTLSSPLHWRYTVASAAQVVRVTRPVVRWAGIERLAVQGGTNPGYNGQMAGGIDVSNAAYCWVKDVQTDGTIGGMHVALTGTYRCVVRDSWFHHSANYGFGADCYGIVLRCGASENLVENNVVRWMNKPILFNVSGGGNVVAYNYADNSWATPPAWQETNIDCHCSFPHMELIEGNFAPHIGATTTHGNAGYLTFYRNFSSSRFADPPVVGFSGTQTGNVAAIQLPGTDVGMNVVGNVLGQAGWSAVYDGSGSANAIYRLGTTAAATIHRHGNHDTVSGATVWMPGNDARTLPASLYRSAPPGWWPAATPWPWAGPDLTPMVGTLPAKARSDATP